MENLKPPEVNRSISCESGASNYHDAMSSFEDDDDDLDCFDGDMMEVNEAGEGGQVTISSFLYKDIENVVFLYGESALCYRVFETIDEIDIDLKIPLGFLDHETAEAWRLNRSEPLIVRLHLSLSMYIESTTFPKIEVFQPSKKENFGFGSQVRKFLESFIGEHWLEVYNKYIEFETIQAKAKKSVSCPTDITQETHEIHKDLQVSDEDIVKLMEFGFDSNRARNALIITRGNFGEACELLQTDEEKCNELSLDVQAQIEEKMSKSRPKLLKRQFSQPPLLAQLKKLLPFTRSSSMTPSATDPGISTRCAMEDLNLLPQSTLDGRNAKKVPSLEEGFLVQLFRYVRQRIPTVNEYCVVCDNPHVFQNGAMLKPSVCSRELCVFAFQTLGVMADAAEDIAMGAEVVDLLINMSATACRSGRKAIIFDPYPTIVDPKDPNNLLFNPKNKDFNAVQSVMDKIPPMQEMTGAMIKGLKQKLEESHPAIYPLMQWIITSNRSHIVKLPPERQLEFMHTPHQFLLLSSPPAKEEVFRQAKEKYGSTFAFHGSSIENWHSIIRHGLKNASGTKLQVNGAAYGKGVYLSPHISTSMGYSRMGYGSHNVKKSNSAKSDGAPRFLQSNNITCIAICEVIVSKDLKKNSSIWVCPNPDYVCTRFFFVYEDGSVGDSSIDTQQKQYMEKIRAACGYKM